ncbi:unnamed protein product [Amoebophrya sp. A25]|nr:unnamed protein product [Amoebophrya sp. A25]|eukprot:GSA25T00025839001.1
MRSLYFFVATLVVVSGKVKRRRSHRDTDASNGSDKSIKGSDARSYLAHTREASSEERRKEERRKNRRSFRGSKTAVSSEVETRKTASSDDTFPDVDDEQEDYSTTSVIELLSTLVVEPLMSAPLASSFVERLESKFLGAKKPGKPWYIWVIIALGAVIVVQMILMMLCCGCLCGGSGPKRKSAPVAGRRAALDSDDDDIGNVPAAPCCGCCGRGEEDDAPQSGKLEEAFSEFLRREKKQKKRLEEMGLKPLYRMDDPGSLPPKSKKEKKASSGNDGRATAAFAPLERPGEIEKEKGGRRRR